MLGPDVDARPTYQQVTQLGYVTQVLKETFAIVAAGAGLWHFAAEGRDHRRQVQAEEGHVHHRADGPRCIATQRMGAQSDAFNPENFSREAEAARPVMRGSRSATASAPVSDGALRCMRPRLRSA